MKILVRDAIYTFVQYDNSNIHFIKNINKKCRSVFLNKIPKFEKTNTICQKLSINLIKVYFAMVHACTEIL